MVHVAAGVPGVLQSLPGLARDLWTRWATIARGWRPSVGVAIAPELAPNLAWYLRDFQTVRVEDPASSDANVVISNVPLSNRAERPSLYMLTTSEVPVAGLSPYARLWRWLTLREPGPGERGLVAYVYERR